MAMHKRRSEDTTGGMEQKGSDETKKNHQIRSSGIIETILRKQRKGDDTHQRKSETDDKETRQRSTSEGSRTTGRGYRDTKEIRERSTSEGSRTTGSGHGEEKETRRRRTSEGSRTTGSGHGEEKETQRRRRPTCSEGNKPTVRRSNVIDENRNFIEAVTITNMVGENWAKKAKTKRCKERELGAIQSERQPKVIYDLFPLSAKNPSFLMRFDLVYPRPRFIIVHRTVRYNFEDLDVMDRKSLLQAGIDAGGRFELSDLTLRIPLALRSKRDNSPFYAYLIAPHVDQFLRIFRLLITDVPYWYSSAWVTPHWPERNPDSSGADHYEQGVQDASPAIESQLRPKVPHRAVPLSKSSNANASAPVFTKVLHDEYPLVGFARSGPRVSRACELLTLMDTMLQIARIHDTRGDADMCISLTCGYRSGSGWGSGVIGFLDFSKAGEVPESLMAISKRSKVGGNSQSQESQESQENNPSVEDQQCQKTADTKEVLSKWQCTCKAISTLAAFQSTSSLFSGIGQLRLDTKINEDEPKKGEQVNRSVGNDFRSILENKDILSKWRNYKK